MIRDGHRTLAAATVYLTAGPVSYYGYNGSSETGRALMAPTLAVWEGIREARRRKLGWLDFDGEYDTRFPIKRFKGFSRFKAGFGGLIVDYPPVFVRWLPMRE
jgi:lipid II:glycine glycyltransferase (peptidoglycan interpeptide bridge formation enzyme)